MTELLSRFGQLYPWLLLALLATPLVLVAWRLKIYPSVAWIAMVVTSMVGSAIAIAWWPLITVVWVVDGLFVLVATADAIVLWAWSSRGIAVHREVSRTGSLGVTLPSDLTVENRSNLTLVGKARDDQPQSFEVDPPEHKLKIPPGGRVTMRRMITPGRRGSFKLNHAFLKFRSPLSLWIRHLKLNVPGAINVYPDMKQLSDYALLARTNRLSLIGVRRTRRIGQDSDFERLRDYTRDDNYRHIDWRSTARRNKLTVRQFQSDQSQRVMFLLDCGRMMTNRCGDYSLLDHAFNSTLMMAYVALAQGDSVGMLCFSDTIHAYIPPAGGRGQMNRLLHAGFDRFPKLVESRYDQAFLYLSNHCKRRSLVVLATNVIDEVNSQSVVDHLLNIRGRHLPVGVLLRDRTMFDAADAAGGDSFAADDPAQRSNSFAMYRAAAAADILLWRHQVLQDLRHRGVLIVDAFPDELTAPLINQYLEIKAKHLL